MTTTSLHPAGGLQAGLLRFLDSCSVAVSVVVLSTIFMVFVLLRMGLKRKNMHKKFRSAEQSLLNIKGDYAFIPYRRMETLGLPRGVGLLEMLTGYSHLYGKDGIFCIFCSYVPFIIATSPEAIEGMISGTKMLDKGWSYRFLEPWLGEGLLTSHGAKWKQRRKLLMKCFRLDILREFMHVFNDKSTIFVSLMQNETEKEFTDIYQPLILCTLDMICESAFGVRISAQENGDFPYSKYAKDAALLIFERMYNYQYWPGWYWLLNRGQKLKKALRNLKDFPKCVIREKKEKLLSGESDAGGRKRKALMDLLLDLHMQQILSEEDVLEEVETFIAAGHDTTAVSLAMTLYLVGHHPEVQDKVHEELDRIFGDDLERPVTTEDLRDMVYMDCVLKESSRVYTTVPFIMRQADKDIIVCGRLIPKGTTCVPFLQMLHQNETEFPNPEKFDPDRFLPENSAKRHPYAFAPFSAGPRNCIGQTFAVMEQKVVIATFLRRYSVESLDPRDRIHLTPSILLQPVGPIRLRIRKRKTST